MRRSRLLWPLVIATVLAVAFRADPGPGLSGAGLGIAIALGGLVAGAAGLMLARSAREPVQQAFLVLLLASSAGLIWLQPNGPAIFALLVAVAMAARLIRGVRGAVVLGAAVVFLGVAREFAGGSSGKPPILLAWLGLVAVYTAVASAWRARRGDEQLLAELERTRQAQVQAAALAERQRLAREMHDVLAHSLSGLAIQLEGARLLAAERHADPVLAGAIERAHHLARTGLQEARRAIGMLRDDQLPGPQRLADLVAEFGRDSGIVSEFTVTGGQRELSSGARLALYRVTQEALTNIRKHAKPDRVQVRLSFQPGGVALAVEDSGGQGGQAGPGAAGGQAVPDGLAAGDAGRPDGGGYGLTGMRERAELLGGTLEAGPTGTGYLVRLWVPEAAEEIR
jgi:signal transduction histidine kinase